MWITVMMPYCKLTVLGSADFFDFMNRRRGIITTRIIATYVAVIAVKGISQVAGGCISGQIFGSKQKKPK
jgi:hypothetical protein